MRARTLVAVVAAGLLGPLVLLGVEAAVTAGGSYATPESAPVVSLDTGPAGAAPLTVAVLGDSTGAGLGVTSGRAADTVGGQLALALGGMAGGGAGGRRVALRGFAVSGARAADLAGQVDRLAAARLPGPLVVLVVIGANDATHLSALPRVAGDVGAALRRLRGLGARVVVGTCPDMGSARAFSQPLRAVVGWRGRSVARAEAPAVVAAGGEPVDLGALTGPAFRRDAGLTSGDRFHPSARGYAVWARALLPAVRRAAA